MSAIPPEGWIDGQPSVYVHTFRAAEDRDRDHIKIGHVVVRGIALHFGSTVWDRLVNLGAAPSHAQIREATASLTADALIALEGQR